MDCCALKAGFDGEALDVETACELLFGAGLDCVDFATDELLDGMAELDTGQTVVDTAIVDVLYTVDEEWHEDAFDGHLVIVAVDVA